MKQEIQQLKPEDYVRLFRVQGLRYLITDIWMEYYKQKGTLVIFHQDHFTSYFPKEIFTQTLQDGVMLFSSVEEFERYKKDFLEYIMHAQKRGEELSLKQELGCEECREFFDLLSDFFTYYTKTEFFYTDLAYRESEKNEVLKQNLEQQGELKNRGRETLNILFFGEEGCLNRILKTVSRQFSVLVGELSDYSCKDIYGLFERKKLQEVERAKRNCFIFQGLGNDVVVEVGERAREVAERFTHTLLGTVEHIKGTIANAGKVRGRVKVIKAGYDNYDSLQAMIMEMNKGDILFSETTSPDLMVACMKAGAIVTDQGGMLSHAAIVSRERGIPCIVGTGNGTYVFKDGEEVEVDAEEGVVRRV